MEEEKFIQMQQPTIPKFEEINDELKEILDSGMITETKTGQGKGNKYNDKLRQMISDYVDVPFVETAPNATLALMIALRAAGLEPGDTVITPSYTYIATTNAILNCGLEPIFVDVDESCGMDVEKAREVIESRKPKAMLPVNLYGNPSNIEGLLGLSANYNIPCIWDDVQSLGSKYKLRRVGGFYHASVFSLSATKLVTAGEGGLICTPDRNLFEKVVKLKWQGMGGTAYRSTVHGYNGRLPEIAALLAVKSMGNLPDNLTRRNQIAKIYREELDGLVEFLLERDRTYCSYYIFPVFTKLNMKIRDHLIDNKIEARTNYFHPAVHLHDSIRFDLLGQHKADIVHEALPMTRKFAETNLSLPIHAGLTDEDVKRVCSKVKEALNQ